mmetsp:Transcript_27910/g.78959  ORF Transcript_27910/g.78959 Transcript_27910/m.78959 type:complete len:280 (+) Transcript_27910:139-978(+)
MELLVEGVSGGVGGLLGRCVAFPFDSLKVKRATSPGHGSVLQLLRAILAEEGVPGLYRGLRFSALEALYQKFVHVFLYAALRGRYRALTGRDATSLGNLVCGYLSDLASVPFSVPLEAAVVQLQSAPASASRAEIVRRALFTRDGLRASLKSGNAYFVLSLKPGIEFAIYEKLKAAVVGRQVGGRGGTNLAPGAAFLVGAVARALATCCLYPYAHAKARLQAGLAPTAWEALLGVLRAEGPLGLYRGLGMELSRGVTQAAVMFAAMEQVRAAVRRALPA